MGGCTKLNSTHYQKASSIKNELHFLSCRPNISPCSQTLLDIANDYPTPQSDKNLVAEDIIYLHQ